MLYIWEEHTSITNDLVGVYDKTASVDRFSLMEGVAVDPEARFIVNCGFKKSVWLDPADLPNTSGVHVVSSSIASVLSEFSANECQLLPAEVFARDGVIEGFKAVIATRALPIMDLEKSDYEPLLDTNFPIHIRSLACEDESLGGLAMARDTNFLPNLFVSQRLRDEIMKLNPRGLEFVPANEYKNT